MVLKKFSLGVCAIAFWCYLPSAYSCTTVAECAQDAVEAALKAEAAHRIAVPKGAVMAFNLNSCPQGWKDIKMTNGRVIVGAGNGNRDQNDKVLTNRVLGNTGGEEAHTLTVNEMPSHLHGGTLRSSGYSFEHHQSNGRLPGESHGYDKNTAETGGGAAHNNMPPYLVLLYCERI